MPVHYYDEYDEMLDDVFGTVIIAGIAYDTSTALKGTDPIAYDVGYADFVDTLEEDEDNA